MKEKKHPYHNRLWMREKLPWFLIDLGVASKGNDCKSVNAEHLWYNNGEGTSACYYCKIVEAGEKWKKI